MQRTLVVALVPGSFRVFRRSRDRIQSDERNDMATIEGYASDKFYDPPAYFQAIKVTGAQALIFVAGQVAYDQEGNPAHRGDFATQARAVFDALKGQVEAGGSTVGNIVKLTIYVTDIRYRTELSAVREEFFGKRQPPVTLLGVTALGQPDWMIEVEATAVV
jgi:enamine deaminase RidA (YjgF/YER057c/UK114 family)